MLTAVAIVIDCLMIAIGFLTASRSLHAGALYRLFRAPMSFFDTTQQGRILNYFSADMDTVDGALQLDVQTWLISFCFFFSTVITIAVSNRIFLVIVLPIILLSVVVQVGIASRNDLRSSLTVLRNGSII